MRETTNYTQEAISDAREMAHYFLDEITEQVIASGEASNDYNNDYPGGDEYHHQYHVDIVYTLTDAADILDALSDHEETDSGLWDGLPPREAISAQAAYTFGNAVSYYWTRIIAEINDARNVSEMDDAIADLEAGESDVSQDTIRQMIKGIIDGFGR